MARGSWQDCEECRRAHVAATATDEWIEAHGVRHPPVAVRPPYVAEATGKVLAEIHAAAPEPARGRGPDPFSAGEVTVTTGDPPTTHTLQFGGPFADRPTVTIATMGRGVAWTTEKRCVFDGDAHGPCWGGVRVGPLRTTCRGHDGSTAQPRYTPHPGEAPAVEEWLRLQWRGEPWNAIVVRACWRRLAWVAAWIGRTAHVREEGRAFVRRMIGRGEVRRGSEEERQEGMDEMLVRAVLRTAEGMGRAGGRATARDFLQATMGEPISRFRFVGTNDVVGAPLVPAGNRSVGETLTTDSIVAIVDGLRDRFRGMPATPDTAAAMQSMLDDHLAAARRYGFATPRLRAYVVDDGIEIRRI